MFHRAFFSSFSDEYQDMRVLVFINYWTLYFIAFFAAADGDVDVDGCSNFVSVISPFAISVNLSHNRTVLIST